MVHNSLITCPNQQRLPKKMEQEKKIRREIANCNERRRMQSINAGFNSLKAMLPKHDNEKLSKASILQQTAEYLQVLEQEKTCYLQELNDIKKLLNPELLELHLKRVQETESKLADQQPTHKRLKVEVSSLDFSNSESSDEGIQLGNASPKRESHDPQWNSNQPNGKACVNSVDNKTVGSVKNGCTIDNGSNPNLQLSQLAVNGNPVQLTGIVDSDDLDVRAELVQVRKVLDKERKLRMKLEEQVRELEAQLYPTRIKEIVQQFQTTGVNIFHTQPLQQIKDNESDLAVSSVIIEQQPVAETVEIETANCTDFIGHLQSANAANLLTNNQPVQITSSNANFISKSSNVNNLHNAIPSTTATLHIIQDLSHNATLLDPTNFVESNGLQFDEITNKILTSTAFLTATTASPTINNQLSNQLNNQITKPAKPKNSSSTNKEKTSVQTIKQSKATGAHPTNSSASGTRDTANQPPNSQSVSTSQSSAGTFKGHHSVAKKSAAPVSNTATNQPATEPNKPDKPKKAKTPSAVELPAILFETGLEIGANNKTQPATVTVQLIDASVTSSIDKFEATPTANSAGRNNNLDTIVEAIRHLEGGDVFGSKEMASAVSSMVDDKKRTSLGELMHLKQELSDKVRTESKPDDSEAAKPGEEIIRKISRPGVIVSTTNS